VLFSSSGNAIYPQLLDNLCTRDICAFKAGVVEEFVAEIPLWEERAPAGPVVCKCSVLGGPKPYLYDNVLFDLPALVQDGKI
jgi:hypothetical protein